MSVITSGLTLSILSTEDSTSNNIFNRSIAPALDSIFGGGVSYFNLPTAPAAAASLFPVSSFNAFPAYCAYVRNLSAVNSVLLTIAFVGDATIYKQMLGVGGVWLIWNTSPAPTPVIGVTTPAISSVSAIASANNSPIEYYFGG